MDKKLFVVFIAVGAILITTLLQLFMQSGKLRPVNKRMLWVVFGAGVLALVCLIAVVLAN